MEVWTFHYPASAAGAQQTATQETNEMSRETTSAVKSEKAVEKAEFQSPTPVGRVRRGRSAEAVEVPTEIVSVPDDASWLEDSFRRRQLDFMRIIHGHVCLVMKKLGYDGGTEKVYKTALMSRLQAAGIRTCEEVAINYRDDTGSYDGFGKADLVIIDSIGATLGILECKKLRTTLSDDHRQQLDRYLRFHPARYGGVVINFRNPLEFEPIEPRVAGDHFDDEDIARLPPFSWQPRPPSEWRRKRRYSRK